MGNADKAIIPGTMLGSYRASIAEKKGLMRKILFRTWGGIGDQICAEPTLRYGIKMFDECEVSLATFFPELYSHLKFKRIFNLNFEQPIYDNYFIFDTALDHTHLIWQFVSHGITYCQDFPAICALRSQLPVADRQVKIQIDQRAIGNEVFETLTKTKEKTVVVHAGKHWPSKTFPKDWWDDVLGHMVFKEGLTPILIGANADDNRTTVDVKTDGCIDLRNKTSILEAVFLCQQARVVITNDSSPLHMAASGDAWIGFIASCKHPDYITHWRKGGWSWRMENLGLGGGMWDLISIAPNVTESVMVESIDEKTLRTWLPEPGKVAEWTTQKIKAWTPSSFLQVL